MASARARTLISSGVVVVLTAALTLWLLGRPLWCTCGTIRLWYGNAWGSENSQQLTDPSTLTHVTHGVLLYGLLWLVARRLPVRSRLLMALAIEATWEVAENTNFVIDRYREVTMALGYYGDSVLNSMGDLAACMLGFGLAAVLPTRVTVAMVMLVEIGLTVWIRDSLALNIVMLVHPMAAVRTWQLGQ